MPSPRASVAAVAVVALLVGLCAAHPEGSSGQRKCGLREFECNDGTCFPLIMKLIGGKCPDGSGAHFKKDELLKANATFQADLFTTVEVRVQYNKSGGVLLEIGETYSDGPYVHVGALVGLLGVDGNQKLRFVNITDKEKKDIDPAENQRLREQMLRPELDGDQEVRDFDAGELVLEVQRRPGTFAVWRRDFPQDVVEVPVVRWYCFQLRASALRRDVALPVQYTLLPKVALPTTSVARARVQIKDQTGAVELSLCGSGSCSEVRLSGVGSDGSLRYKTYKKCAVASSTDSCTLHTDRTEGSGAFPLGELVLKVKSQPGKLSVWREGRPDDVAVVPVDAATNATRIFSVKPADQAAVPFDVYPACGEEEFRCRLESESVCISATLRCDGAHDCADGSDEQACDDTRPHKCGVREFQCSDGAQCVSLSKRCNDQQDCADGSDEAGCNATTIDLPLYAVQQVDGYMNKYDTGFLLQVGSAKDGPRWLRVGLLGQERNGTPRYLENCSRDSCGQDDAQDFFDFSRDSAYLLVEHRPGQLVLRSFSGEARAFPIDGAFDALRIASLRSTSNMTARVVGTGGAVIPANATVTARLTVTETREDTTIEVSVSDPKHFQKIGKVWLEGVRANGTLRYRTFTNCSDTRPYEKCTLLEDHTEGSGGFPRGELVLKVKSQPGELSVWREDRPDDVVVVPVDAADCSLIVYSRNYEDHGLTNFTVHPV